MVMNFDNGVPFDPGFVQHISAIIPNIQYVYTKLGKYKNFGQKKNQFKMILPKLDELINNYIGFYAGCILWAQIIKDMDKPVTNNFCVGGEYNENETLQEVRFLKEFLVMFPKDVKYYAGKDYVLYQDTFKILDLYEEFLKDNEGFIKVEKTSDLKIPADCKPLGDKQKVLEKIEEVVATGKLSELRDYIK